MSSSADTGGDPGSLVWSELDETNQAEVRSLILDGLGEHWGSINPSLNPDLDDMVATYGAGSTVVVRGSNGDLLGTGTIVMGERHVAEIVRMSVAQHARRHGIGRLIVERLLDTARSLGAVAVVLETTSAWEEVVRFYVSCGFEVTHTTESEFGTDTWFRYEL
ncbi:MAG: GNAT family N-acetyltransferase [Acidimicrobiales bacterium]